MPAPIGIAYYPTPVVGDTLDFKSYKATGSITGGTNTFVLGVANPGFQIGDPIIVEVGGEAGAGQRGTRGVGGTWPALSYADAGARDADGGQALNTYAWIETDSSVHQWNGSTWTAVAESQYYASAAVPRALITTITNISGSNITLNANAAVTATNATIHYDNHPYWDLRGQGGSGFTPTNNTWIVPEGEFAFSDRMWSNGHHSWRWVGQGSNRSMIFSPKGVPSLTVQINGSNSCLIRKIHFKGNARRHGYGLGWGDHGAVTETLLTQGMSYPRGVIFSACTGGLVEDCLVTDMFQCALSTSFSTDIWAKRNKIVVTDAIPQYVQWQALWADSTRGGCIGLEIDSAYMTGGIETFRSNGVMFKNVRCRNASASMNSSGNFLFEDCYFYVDVDAIYKWSGGTSFSLDNPIMNCNSNIQPPTTFIAQGGTIKNCVIDGRNLIDTALGGRVGPIIVNLNNPNVKIIGTDPTYERCTVYVANYSGDGKQRASGIHSTGANTRIEGYRVKPVTNGSGPFSAGWGDIMNGGGGGRGGTIINCVVDAIGTSTGTTPGSTITQSGNQTNNQFES